MTATLATIIGRGLASARPAAGIPGRLYYSTDTSALERDNGASWDTMASGGGGGAPTTSEYWVETADAGLSAEVVVGTTGITKAAYASRQAAAKAGRLFLPTNGRAIYRDSGSAWQGWGPVFPLTDVPIVSGWTWVNQSTATAVDDGQGGIYLALPANASTNLRGLVRSAPSTPYVITAVIQGALRGVTQNSVGIVHREAATSKIRYLQFYLQSNVLHVGVANYTNSTTFSAGAGTDLPLAPLAIPYLLQLEDNGTTVYYRFSHDGVTWTELYSVARTTFFTTAPDQVGFFGDASNASYGPAATLASWLVA